MATRQEALRHYLIEVTKDLVARGVIRRTLGQPLEQILREEATTVLGEVRSDFAAVAAELGLGLFRAVAQKGASDLFNSGMRALEDLIAGRRRG